MPLKKLSTNPIHVYSKYGISDRTPWYHTYEALRSIYQPNTPSTDMTGFQEGYHNGNTGPDRPFQEPYLRVKRGASRASTSSSSTESQNAHTHESNVCFSEMLRWKSPCTSTCQYQTGVKRIYLVYNRGEDGATYAPPPTHKRVHGLRCAQLRWGMRSIHASYGTVVP